MSDAHQNVNEAVTLPFPKKRRYDMLLTQNDHSNNNHHHAHARESVCKNNDFVFLSCDWKVYHSETVTKLPYSTNQKAGDADTLYLPLTNNIMINTKLYHEITFDSGHFFIANDKGYYEQTVQGTVVNFLVHCSHERRMYTARSVLILDEQIADKIASQLLQK